MDWDRYEHELGARTGPPPDDPDAADAARVLVDSPEAQRPARPGLAGLRAAERRPILPGWLRSRAELAAMTGWAAGFAAHTSGYHLARSPVYAGRLAARAPRGAARTLAGWLRWLFDLEAEPVRAATVRAQDADAYLKLARQRDRRVRWRATASTGLLWLPSAWPAWSCCSPRPGCAWQRSPAWWPASASPAGPPTGP